MEKRYLYEIRPTKPIRIAPGKPPINRPCSALLTKSEVLDYMKCGPVYRKFADANIPPMRVTGANINSLHQEKYDTSTVPTPLPKKPALNIVDGGLNIDTKHMMASNIRDPEVAKWPKKSQEEQSQPVAEEKVAEVDESSENSLESDENDFSNEIDGEDAEDADFDEEDSESIENDMSESNDNQNNYRPNKKKKRR